VAFTLLVAGVLGCTSSQESGGAYTLIRSSVADQMLEGKLDPNNKEPPLRIHVATFDAAEGAKYNAENCEIARDLFESQPGVTVRYWCEKGRYQK